MRHFVFLIAIFVSLIPDLRADEPFFKPNDVVALVGGEDMVVAAELGYLETLIQLALPDHHLKFRSLAREGDTVFEQRRDLNYPKLEDQLDKMGATVVICQFGQMESLMAMGEAPKDKRDEKDAKDKKDPGKADVPLVPSVPSVPEKADAARKAKVGEFVAAYEKLIARLKGKDGARRIAIAMPLFRAVDTGAQKTQADAAKAASGAYHFAALDLAKKTGVLSITSIVDDFLPVSFQALTANGHLNEEAHQYWALGMRNDFVAWADGDRNATPEAFKSETLKPLRDRVAAKNRLWYYYYRPQNWAFLAGDRTNQPSSRDHLDPSKRWFPEELEKFVPLIDAKDAEIWALAKKLSGQGGK